VGRFLKASEDNRENDPKGEGKEGREKKGERYTENEGRNLDQEGRFVIWALRRP
jgi:hypothetical protein